MSTFRWSLALVLTGGAVGLPDAGRVTRGSADPRNAAYRVDGDATILFPCARAANGSGVCACFAPGTSPEYMNQFVEALRGVRGAAYSASGRWSFTSSDGATGGSGDPITLTYSFVPDYSTGDPSDSNVLHQAFDAAFGSRSAWQDLFRAIFADWSAITGIHLVEVSDDGAAWPESPGAAGLRGDVRIISFAIDGPNNVLAYNFFPDTGDMAFDSAENWAASANDYRFFRNVVMHEFGHGLGLDHILPRDGTKLMEAFLNLGFLGPQDDDIRGADRSYGDRAEPNNSVAAAANFGPFNANAAFENLSLNSAADEDWYAFSAVPGQTVAARVDPVGGQYDLGPDPGTTATIDTLAINPLRIDIFDAAGATLLRTTTAAAPGQSAETVSVDVPPADSGILIRISTDGTANDVQRYRLVLTESNATLRILEVRSTPVDGFSITASPADLAGTGILTTPADATYQDGTTVTLTAPANSGSSSFVRWNLDGAAQPASQTALTVSMSAGHTAEAVYVVGLSVDAGADVEIVAGESAELSAFATGGTLPYVYSWTPPGTLSDASSSHPVAVPAQTTNYIVAVTDGLGKQTTDRVQVKVVDPLSADAGPKRVVFTGMNFKLAGSGGGGSLPYVYSWSPVGGLSDSTSATPTGAVNATTTYTLTVTDARGRSASDTTTVEVATAVTVDAGEDQVIVEGSAALLGAVVSGGAPPYSFAWTPPGVAVEANGQSIQVLPEEDTTYRVLVTDALGQQAGDEVQVLFARSLSVRVGADPQTIAAGETSTLSGGASGGIEPYTYVWSPADSVADSMIAVTVAIPVETTTYTLTVEDSTGQRRSTTVRVTVGAVPGAAPSNVLAPPLPGPCGLGIVGSMPFMILSCISVRRLARRPRPER